MKKLIISCFLVIVMDTVFAQHGGRAVVFRPRAAVVLNSGVYTPLLYSSLWFSYPYYDYYMQPRVIPAPSKLDQEIADITHDYTQKIKSARMDHSLKGKQRRQDIRVLKSERDARIDLAKRHYYQQQ